MVYIGQKDERLAKHLKDRFKIFDEAYFVPAGKFRRYHNESVLAHLIDVKTIALNIRDVFRTLAGIGYARKLLKQIQPDVVFCKGGFVGAPVGIAAHLQKIPLVTHDSDTVPGLANRIVGRFAQVHATGMPASYYKYPKASMRYVGIPLDERIKPVTRHLQLVSRQALGLPAESLILLIGGAGQGARDVNNLVLKIAPELLSWFDKLQIVHVAGLAHEQTVAIKYKELPSVLAKRVKVLGFTPDFYKYTAAADLIVSRAGATTIAELAAQKKPAVLIPAPHLTGGHQLKNAQELSKQKAAVVVANDVKPEEFLQVITKTLEDVPTRRDLAEQLGKLAKPGAADKLAQILLKIAARSQR